MAKSSIMSPKICGLGTSLLVSSLMAQAQVQPNIGDVLRQVPIQAPIDRAAPTLPNLAGAPLERPMHKLPDGGKTVVVKQFVVAGNRNLRSDLLRAQLPDPTGQRYSLADLEKLAGQLTRYYRGQGFFVARVYVPAQELKDGVLLLRVVEGSYGQFFLENQSLVKAPVLQAMLDAVKPRDIVSLDTLERVMLLINDTPGAEVVRADVMPGQAVGTSDFAIGTKATARHQGFVLADNHGSRYTGRERVSFNWDWNSPTGGGDRVSVSGLGAANLRNGRVGYAMPLSPTGWRGEVSATQTSYSLGDSYKALDALGTARGFDLGLSYPIHRTRAQTVELVLNVARRNLKDEVRLTNSETRKVSKTASVGVNVRDDARMLGADGVSQGSVRLTAGNLDILDSAARTLDQAAGGAHTQGSFAKLNVDVSRSSVLPNAFTLAARLRHQSSLGSKNLDGSERMGIAGDSGVTAYPSGEAAGTDATLIGLELSRALPELHGLQHQWMAAANWGQARTVRQDAYRALSDISVGWSARHANGLVVKAVVSKRLSSRATSEPDAETRVLVQAGWVF